MSAAMRDMGDDLDSDIDLNVDYDLLVADDNNVVTGLDTVDSSAQFNEHE